MAANGRLSLNSQAAYDAIVLKYILSDDGLLTLRGGLEMLDTYRQACRHVNRHHRIIRVRKNPTADLASAAFRNYLRAMRYLGLNADLGDADI
jgi:hypothetical protein